MEMSTKAAPFFICRTMDRVTSLGAAAPGTKTAPITKSAARTSSTTFWREAISRCTRPANW